MADCSKQRLRPWLEAQINGGQVEGLCWINKEKTKFRIPWRHGGTQNWTKESSQIFMEWAKHTGRYREGVDEPDWVAWKTRLRCALHKASDITLIKAESQTEVPDSYRVYDFKPQKNGRTSTHNDQTLLPATELLTARQPSIAHQEARNEAPIPTFLNDYMAISGEDKLPSDLKDVATSNLISGAEQMSITKISMDKDVEDIKMISDSLSSVHLSQPPPVAENSRPPLINENEMLVKVVYNGNTVVEKKVETSDGCQIYYGSLGPQAYLELQAPEWMHGTLYGKPDSIHLPLCHGLMGNASHEANCQKVLDKGLAGGILLKCHQNDVYAYRLCQCSIFHASSLGTAGEPVKLPRDREDHGAQISIEKIFDYTGKFLPALGLYGQSRGPRPEPNVYLFVGAQKTLKDLEKNAVLIYIEVTTQRAQRELSAVEKNKKIPSQVLPAIIQEDIDELLKEYLDTDLLTRPQANSSSSNTAYRSPQATQNMAYQPPPAKNTTAYQPTSATYNTIYQPPQIGSFYNEHSENAAEVLERAAFGTINDYFDEPFDCDFLGGSRDGRRILDDFTTDPIFLNNVPNDYGNELGFDDVLIADLMLRMNDSETPDLLKNFII